MPFVASNSADVRLDQACAWAAEQLGITIPVARPVSGDASFRRYFRFEAGERSLILMDAPPEKENSAPFVDIAKRLRSAGLNAPEVLSFDLDRGFGLLQDFGDTLYRELIDEDTAERLFPALFDILTRMATRVDDYGLPLYTEDSLQLELNLFTDWYLARHKQRPLRAAEQEIWRQLCTQLNRSALDQKQAFVHRDFHSCNLLQTAGGPAIIDFQDGVRGPLSYDLVSLLWDRYVAWPRPRLEQWMGDMYIRLGLDCGVQEWIRQCDWMGLQRNLKIVGIFSRLRYRDGRQGYVEMIPRFYQYLLDVVPRYPQFDNFRQLIEDPECAP